MINVRYKYIFFDFDGTLADTEEAAFIIYQKIAERYNLKHVSRSELSNIKKMSARELMEFLEVKKRHLPGMLKRGKKLLKQDIRDVPACKSDFFDVINRIKQMGIRTAIITSNSKTNVRLFLEKHGIDVFDCIMSSSMFGKESKIRKLMRREKLTCNEVLYVGDEIRDINAARRAGIDIAAVAWGYNTADSLRSNRPEYLIFEPMELLDICRRR